MWATWPCTPSQSKKNVGTRGKNASFQRVALSPQNWPGLGPAWARAAPQLCPSWLGANWSPSWSQRVRRGWSWAQIEWGWTPPWSYVMRMEVQVTSKIAQLGIVGNSFAPSWAQRRHNMGNIAQHEASSMPKASENACFARNDIWTSKGGPNMWCFLTSWHGNVLRATTACTFPTWARCALYILTWKCASRHKGVHFFDISTSKSAPRMVCFVHFDFEMCFAPQRRALFRHLNLQKCSNVHSTTRPCSFSSLI